MRRKPDPQPIRLIPATEAEIRADLKRGGWSLRVLREWPPEMAKFDADYCRLVNAANGFDESLPKRGGR